MLCVHINLSKILFCAKEKPVPRLVSVRTVKQKKKKTYINKFLYENWDKPFVHGTINIVYQECLGPRGCLSKELCSVYSCVPKVKGHFLTFYLSTINDLWWRNKN